MRISDWSSDVCSSDLLMDEANPLPIVPLALNTYYAPNQPTPRRCYALGQAIRRAVESYPEDIKVAVIASGGLSHFVVDEELDRGLIEASRTTDVAAPPSMAGAEHNSGSRETLNKKTNG